MIFSPAPSPPPPTATGRTRWRWAIRARTRVARQLLQWRYALDRNSGAKFADIDAVLKMAADWPLRDTLYARAEAAITPDMTPAQIIAWFGGRAPASAIGRIRLGEAMVATGDRHRRAAR